MNRMIPVAEPALIGNERKYVDECLSTGWISSKGKFISLFEEGFSKFCGVKYGCSCFNGTVALHLALKALGIKEGDEVIVPSLTFIAPANAVKYCNAEPVFVDSEKDTWNIDASKIEAKITSKTKAIIPVHLYGHPADMKTIMKIAKKHNLFVIEDCAEAHGAEIEGRKVGSFGDIGCFSFFGNKIVTTGEGGICVSNNKELIEKAVALKNHGMNQNRKYWHDIIGFNYRMTNIQAAIGLAQIENIDKFIDKRRADAKLYNEELAGARGVVLPPEKPLAKNVYWMYSILIEGKGMRDKVMEALKKENIDTRPFFYPITDMPPYNTKEKFPVAEKLSITGMNLPSSYSLKKEDILRICKIIKKTLG